MTRGLYYLFVTRKVLGIDVYFIRSSFLHLNPKKWEEKLSYVIIILSIKFYSYKLIVLGYYIFLLYPYLFFVYQTYTNPENLFKTFNYNYALNKFLLAFLVVFPIYSSFYTVWFMTIYLFVYLFIYF